MKRLARAMAIAFLLFVIAVLGIKVVQELRRPFLTRQGEIADDWRRHALLEGAACRRRYGDPAPRSCLRPDEKHGQVTIDEEGFFTTTEEELVEPELSVICLGGDTTQGLREEWARGDYPSTLARALGTALPAARIQVRSAGVQHSRTVDLAIRFEHDIRPARPDILVLLPEPRAFETESLIEIETQLRNILEHARADGIDVLLSRPPVREECRRKPATDDPDAPRQEVGIPPDAAEAMHAALGRLALLPGVTVVDHRARFKAHPFGCELYGPDGKLNRLGQDLLGVELARAVAERYRRGNQRGTESM